MLLATLLAQAETVEPLEGTKILLVLGIIVVLCFAVVIAGLGYFSPGRDD